MCLGSRPNGCGGQLVGGREGGNVVEFPAKQNGR